MAKTLGLLLVVMMLAGTASAQQIAVKPVEPGPAWCGGAWEPVVLREVVEDAKTVRVPVPGTGGTNFGPCVPIEREVRALDGNMTTVSIPTYPSYPALLVTFQEDPKTGELRAGRMVTETDKDGKPVSKWVEIEPRVLPAKPAK
jgi:hypothetical protein